MSIKKTALIVVAAASMVWATTELGRHLALRGRIPSNAARCATSLRLISHATEDYFCQYGYRATTVRILIEAGFLSFPTDEFCPDSGEVYQLDTNPDSDTAVRDSVPHGDGRRWRATRSGKVLDDCVR